MFWFLLGDNQVRVSNTACFFLVHLWFPIQVPNQRVKIIFYHRSKYLERCQENGSSPLTEDSLAPFLLKIMRCSECVNRKQKCVK